MSQTLPTPALQGALPLPDWGLIRARGADAAKFLHGQLTQDIEHLGPGQARLAGYCSAKGRLLASLVVWREAEDILLACSADLLAQTLKRLSMFVLRAQCKLEDASAQRPLHGLMGEAAGQWLGAPLPMWGTQVRDDGTAVRLPDADGQPRWLWAAASGAAAPGLPALDAAAWARAEVHSGVPRIVAATVEQFVPQMVNLELVGGVNFQKGCYPGQEVVARSQYRGTLKRRAFVFDADQAAAPGQELFHSEDPGQPAGQVANAAPGSLLAEVKLAAMRSGSLHLGTPDGPLLRPRAMPYAVPQGEDATGA